MEHGKHKPKDMPMKKHMMEMPKGMPPKGHGPGKMAGKGGKRK